MAQSFAISAIRADFNPVSAFAMMKTMVALARQRRQLKGLSASALHDLGISRSQAEQESKRAFWDVPAGWRNR